MPFRKRQPLDFDGFAIGLDSQLITHDDGHCERVARPYNSVLPDTEMFDPTACINAGVNLNELNTQILGPSFEAAPVADEVVEDVPETQKEN